MSIRDENSPGRNLRLDSGCRRQLFGSVCDLETKIKSINDFLRSTSRSNKRMNVNQHTS
jgi:hypothetical protein